MGKTKSKKVAARPAAESYQHPQADVALRPDVGTQAQFRKKKPPATYRYDSSLSPSLEWDGENSARELGEWLLRQIEEAAALEPPHTFSAHAGHRPKIGRDTVQWPQPRVQGGGRQGPGHGGGPAGRGGATQAARAAVPELGGQGRAGHLRRAHAAPVRPRAALHQGDRRDADRPPPRKETQARSSTSSATPSTRSPTRSWAPTSSATAGSTA